MKSALIFAVVVSTAAADCHLHASYKHLSASVVIPSITTISDACCTDVQNIVTEAMNHVKDSDYEPSQEEEGQTMQDCESFVGYMEEWKMQNDGPPSMKDAARLPAGFKFREYKTGEATSACTLHASLGDASISCDIPASTTISTDCCNLVQGTIDQPPSEEEKQQLQQDAMTKCGSVAAWAQQRAASLGPPPNPPANPDDFTPEPFLKYIEKALPAGLSCTESTESGMSSRVLNAILQVVERNGRSGVQELETQPASSSLLPTIFVAGTAGAFGGLVAFFAVSKLSSKPQRIALISDEA